MGSCRTIHPVYQIQVFQGAPMCISCILLLGLRHICLQSTQLQWPPLLVVVKEPVWGFHGLIGGLYQVSALTSWCDRVCTSLLGTLPMLSWEAFIGGQGLHLNEMSIPSLSVGVEFNLNYGAVSLCCPSLWFFFFFLVSGPTVISHISHICQPSAGAIVGSAVHGCLPHFCGKSHFVVVLINARATCTIKKYQVFLQRNSCLEVWVKYNCKEGNVGREQGIWH